MLRLYLTFDRDTEAEGPAEDGAGRGRRPHDAGGEQEAALRVGNLDPLGVGRLVQSLDRNEPHLPLLPGQRDHQLLLGDVLHLEHEPSVSNIIALA